ncbi:MAG: 16S rRNA (cytosine(967)-C(5))-methyltransferase RsmB [Oscillospiraceae bacterium]|nr:16S rRNA (cytosine(967)-C(5))-methyltransferase RsmB [Oscillospiraceae bacterium]
MSARDTALAVLIACRKSGAWSDSALKAYIARDGLDRRDAAFATRLCFGVIQNRRLLDFYIASFLSGKLKSLQPIVLDILRLGAYQIAFMDRVPSSAAVNEAVNQTKRFANLRAAGLVNGVLRAMSRAEALPEPKELSVRYSHSPELIARLRENVGDALLEPLLKSHNEVPPTTVQVNTLRAETEEVRQALQAEKHPWLADCLQMESGNLEALAPFARGEIYAQDAASKLAVLAAELRPGMRVLDCCAAPGGKSFAAAISMRNEGEILACDLHAGKLRRVAEGAARMGLFIIQTQPRDARAYIAEECERYDAVLCDAPCSGLGVIRKKPDIREKALDQIAALPKIQLEILQTVSRYLKPGGTLIYSTCTILKRENEELVQSFLQGSEDFSLQPFAYGEINAPSGMLTLLPCVHGTDGFFIAKLRKNV